MREGNKNGRCPQCGNELVDQRVESRHVAESNSAVPETLRAYQNTKNWKLAIIDSFTENNQGWQTGEFEEKLVLGNLRIGDNRYAWHWKAKKDYAVVSTTLPGRIFSDFALRLDFRIGGTGLSPDCGVTFREVDSNNYYGFTVDSERYCNIYALQNGRRTTFFEDDITCLVPDSFRVITVIAERNHFTFYVNDQFISEIDDNRFGQGSIGLITSLDFAGDEAMVEFYRFELHVP
jgi:hypothetical protein